MNKMLFPILLGASLGIAGATAFNIGMQLAKPDQVTAHVGTTGARCTAIDGDTLDCDGERVRLNGVDAPEMPGHCARGRTCVQGDHEGAKAWLQSLVENHPAEIIRLGTDRYGRTIGQVTADGLDLSCAVIGMHGTIYVERWDDGGRTAAACE